MPDLIEGWKAQLGQDLRSFADRGVEPTFEADGNTLCAYWQVQGSKREALFTLKPGGRLRWAGPSGDEPYYAFLASEAMAGFPQLASACLATIEGEPDFVASEAVLDSGFGTETTVLTPEALTDLIDGARTQAEEGLSTQVFFLKGDAGAGKTTLLREATLLQARRYLAGESEFLCLYVPAQGRELSNLRDAFAGELGELRAAFTQDAIASLAREGVLVPVIDGFDELLGTAGYGGAFSSLQTFLGELEGYGTLVVSARSAFYDIEFGRSRGRNTDTAMRITTAQVQPWSDEQLEDYLNRERAGREPAATAAALERLAPADRELLRRPFFASQFEHFVARADGDGKIDLLEHLIDAYIEREAGKLLNAHDEPVLGADGHRYLFELVVSEMWENGVRQLSENDLRTVAELVAEEFKLDVDQATQLATKVTSYAGFQPRRGAHSSQASFAFEHEVYFDHFLGRAMGRLLRDSRLDELMRFIDSAVIPEEVAAASVRNLGDSRPLDPSLLKCASGVSFDNRRRNLGNIVLAYGREVKPLADVTVHGLSFVDVTSGKARIVDVRLEDCKFIDVNLCDAVFENCEAGSCELDGITVNAATRLGISGLRPGLNIKRIHYEPSGYVFAPDAIAALLERLGGPAEEDATEQPVYSEHAKDLIRLLERVARAFQRTTFLYEKDNRRSVLGSPHWEELKRLLIEHGVISEELREAKGANVPAYRLRANSDELLAGQNSQGSPHSSTAGLWEALRSM